ncbi:adenosine deaminase family protein [Georgenia sp. Z1344]|uniref:adenosine deaminase family protein n=1 Tax=Georgenia sp. Z1344 TaxID=3416706 RepID=UPI003CF86F1B
MAEATGAVTADVGPDAEAFLRRLPKVDLHCHLLGTVRPTTFGDLARREGLSLPDAPERIFADINSTPPDPSLYLDTRIPMPQGRSDDEPDRSYSLFEASDWVRQVLRGPDDLTRIVYEALEDAHTVSGTRHVEFSIDRPPPQIEALGYAQMVEAYAEGIRLAERDFGITARMLAAVDRSGTGEEALEWIRTVVDHPHEHLVGIGLDNLETSGPPERFVDAYRLAGEAGLRRTAHTSEHVPSARNAVTCLDVLGCERLDHGYFVLEDDAVVARMRDEQVAFTVVSTTSRRSWRPWRRASIRAMLDAGLNVFPASDDPGMFPTTLLSEYRILHDQVGVGLEKLAAMALAGVEASWLPEAGKDVLRSDIRREAEALAGGQE